MRSDVGSSPGHGERLSVDSRELADRMRQTVSDALAVLNRMEDTLRRSGFPDGGEHYKRMTKVLAAQLLWYRDRGIDDLETEYRAVSAVANRIGVILAPYVEAMITLSALASAPPCAVIEQPPAGRPQHGHGIPTHHTNDDGRVVLARLAEMALPATLARLRDQTRLSMTRLRRAVRQLEDEGSVSSSVQGGRRVYAIVG